MDLGGEAVLPMSEVIEMVTAVPPKTLHLYVCIDLDGARSQYLFCLISPMSSEDFENWVPFISRRSSEDSASTQHDKPLPELPWNGRPRFRMRAFLSELWGWPGLVIGGQLILQSLAWGFFAVVQRRGSVALPLSMALSAQAHPHRVTQISTLISTGLAACST
jgi:hypothetical protein